MSPLMWTDGRLTASRLLALCWLGAIVACSGPSKEEPPVDPSKDSTEDSEIEDSTTDDSEADDSEEDPDPVDLDKDGYAADVDCDDNNRSVYPGAYEYCDDGVENDCDGALDCADSSCADSSCSCAAKTECEEVCTDGRDNDLDALIDCEDGDCATFAACVEDCTDGVDGDGDSFVDCLDDDCWASCDVKITNKLYGGSLSYTHSIWDYTDVTAASSYTGTTIVGEARSLSGSIELNGPDGVIQCSWAVPRAEFWLERKTERSLYTSSWSIITSSGAHVADSVSLAPGCPLPGDTVLPARLLGASMPSSVGGLEQIYFYSGGTWYSGEATVLFSGYYGGKRRTHKYVMEIPSLNPVTSRWSP